MSGSARLEEKGAHAVWFQDRHRGSWDGRGRHAHVLPQQTLLHTGITTGGVNSSWCSGCTQTNEATVLCLGPQHAERSQWLQWRAKAENLRNKRLELMDKPHPRYPPATSHPIFLCSSPPPQGFGHLSSLSESASAHSNLGIPNLFQTWNFFLLLFS